MRYERISSFSSVLVLCLCLVLGPSQSWAQRPELPPGLTRDLPLTPLPAPGFAHGKTVYVETFGRDLPRCGTQQMPCRTINHGLSRARQIQDDPVAADEPGTPTIFAGLENLVTVQVGPGTYSERVTISANRIRLLGAGPGSSILTGGPTPGVSDVVAVRVEGAPVWIEGFSFSGDTELDDAGLLVDGFVIVTNCEFADYENALFGFNSTVVVDSSTFSNNAVGAAIVQNGSLSLRQGVTITGQGSGIGVVATGGASVQIVPFDCLANFNPPCLPSPEVQITNTFIGVLAISNATVNIDRGEISHNGFGVLGLQGSVLTLSLATISDNAIFGVSVAEGSFLRTFGGEVTGNGTGIFFDAFSHGVLDPTTNISGNGTDKATDPTSAFVFRP